MNWLVWYEMNAMEVCEMDHEFDSKEMVMYVGMSDCCKGKQQTHSPQIDAVHCYQFLMHPIAYA